MRILVTGVAGFVGSAVASKLLSEGFEVFGLDNFFSGFEKRVPQGVRFHWGDVRDFSRPKGWDGINAVVHLAAQSSVERSFSTPDYDLETNIGGTYRCYEFAKSQGARLVINVSTTEVYDPQHDKGLATESTETRPISPHANSKLSAENLLSLLSSAEQGPSIVNLRLSSVFGPGQNLSDIRQGWVNLFLGQFLNFDVVNVKGEMDWVRDCIYLEDVVSAILCILRAEDTPSGLYNLASGHAPSVEQLLTIIARCTGQKRETRVLPGAAGHHKGFAISNDLFCGKFGWKPAFDVERGIEQMLRAESLNKSPTDQPEILQKAE